MSDRWGLPAGAAYQRPVRRSGSQSAGPRCNHAGERGQRRRWPRAAVLSQLTCSVMLRRCCFYYCSPCPVPPLSSPFPLASFHASSSSLLVCFRSYLYISIISFLLISGLPVNNKHLLATDKHKPYSAKSLEPLGCATQLNCSIQHNTTTNTSRCWIFPWTPG